MLKINYSNKALKFYKGVPEKQKKQVIEKVESLRLAPFPNDSKKLKGFPYHRVDIGEFRIIYKLEGDTLHVVRIGPRNDGDCYKSIRRLMTLLLSNGLLSA